MRKYLLLYKIIFIVCVYSNCMLSGMNYYEGYIYTIERQPIQGLRIYPRDGKYFYCDDSSKWLINDENRFKQAKADSAAGVTDENGYFKFRQPKDVFWRFLMIGSEIKTLDTVQVAWVNHYGWRNLSKYFVDGRADTIFFDMKSGKSIFPRQSHSYE